MLKNQVNSSCWFGASSLISKLISLRFKQMCYVVILIHVKTEIKSYKNLEAWQLFFNNLLCEILDFDQNWKNIIIIDYKLKIWHAYIFDSFFLQNFVFQLGLAFYLRKTVTAPSKSKTENKSRILRDKHKLSCTKFMI